MESECEVLEDLEEREERDDLDELLEEREDLCGLLRMAAIQTSHTCSWHSASRPGQGLAVH